MTPGQHGKHYMAGALEARTREILWGKGDHKNSRLVIALLEERVRCYPQARKIHVILDNFKIHDSQATRAAVAALDGKEVLPPLPPYGPDHNKIERTRKDLHDDVTRHHKCRMIEELMQEGIDYIRRRNRQNVKARRKAAA